MSSRRTVRILRAAGAPVDSALWSSRACSSETVSQTPAAVSALTTRLSADIINMHCQKYPIKHGCEQLNWTPLDCVSKRSQILNLCFNRFLLFMHRMFVMRQTVQLVYAHLVWA